VGRPELAGQLVGDERLGACWGGEDEQADVDEHADQRRAMHSPANKARLRSGQTSCTRHRDSKLS
jgi:hypothetical protein